MHKKITLLLILLLSLLRFGYADFAHPIANDHPNDDPAGLAGDSRVLLVENFESYTTGITGTALGTALLAGTNPTGKASAMPKPYGTWTLIPHPDKASIVTDPVRGKVWQGNLPAGIANEQTSVAQQALYHPKVHIRWYQKWASNYLVAYSNHNGGELAGGTIGGVPGGIPPANGSGWFSFNLSNENDARIKTKPTERTGAALLWDINR
jgi:hypothetical protein